MVIKEQYEGAESREFWEGLGHKSRVADRSLYLSLAEKPKENRYDYTSRLFHLTSWTGQFRADEVAPSSRFPQLPCPYPFVQVKNTIRRVVLLSKCWQLSVMLFLFI